MTIVRDPNMVETSLRFDRSRGDKQRQRLVKRAGVQPAHYVTRPSKKIRVDRRAGTETAHPEAWAELHRAGVTQQTGRLQCLHDYDHTVAVFTVTPPAYWVVNSSTQPAYHVGDGTTQSAHYVRYA